MSNSDNPLKTRFILPFCTPASNRIKDFSKEMEMAAILYLAESDRKKVDSRILKKENEKFAFVTEGCYPVWLMPYDGATLIFDGLGITSHSIYYDAMPDINIFDKDIRENRKTIDAYGAALSRNADYFKNFQGREQKMIQGLIATPDLKNDFSDYFSQMTETQRPFMTHAFLTPAIDDHEIESSTQQLLILWKRINEDISAIDASMKLLKSATAETGKTIRENIKKTQKKYDEQIANVKPRVKRKILQVQNKYQSRIIRASKSFKKRLEAFRTKQVKLQKTLKHLKTEAKRCEARMQKRRRGKTKRRQTRWMLRLGRIKRRLPILEKAIDDTIKKMREIEAVQQFELARLKTECDTRIEAVNRTLRDLQASKEAVIVMKKQETATIEGNSSHIASQMYEMRKTKKAALEEFSKIIVPGRKQETTLVYVPFYLVRYETEDKRRYAVYPPSIVRDMEVLTKMKGALGATKMKALLRFRSKAITKFLNQIVTLIEQNPMLEKEVTEAGIQNSVLLTKQLRLGIKKGLKELENENWISKEELQSFGRLLYIYA